MQIICKQVTSVNSKLSCWLIDKYAKIYMLFNCITPVDTMQINDFVYAVKTGQVNFYIYIKDNNAICIDSGFGKAIINRELRKLKVSPDVVSHVFLTHTDFDHASGIDIFPKAKVYLSMAEEVMITKTSARIFGIIYNKLSRNDYELLEDNDTVMVGNIKIKAILTPGHTLGSMSYLIDDRFLFTGDAFRTIAGKVQPIRPILTMNTESELSSIYKLAHIPNVQAVFTAHRGYSNSFYEIMDDYIN